MRRDVGKEGRGFQEFKITLHAERTAARKHDRLTPVGPSEYWYECVRDCKRCSSRQSLKEEFARVSCLVQVICFS